jgi:glycine/D-amino acid oxidase-like deaminating enzyme
MNRGDTADVIVVGGGVAGLSAALVLAEHKLRVLLVERGPALASEASGNNAAIFRPLEHNVASAELPRRSLQLLEDWFGGGLLEPTGLVLVSSGASSVLELADVAARAGVAHDMLDKHQLHSLAPSLLDGEAAHGLLLRDGGVLDVPRFTAQLATRARSLGAELRTDVAVGGLTREHDRVTGVALLDGSQLTAACVIVAAGAWNCRLGETAGLGLPFIPLRRHLVELRAPVALASREPVVWRLEDEVYYRTHGADVLASPCDETHPRAFAAGISAAHSDAAHKMDSQPDPSAIPLLREKLQRLAPSLARGSIVRAWACLRTFADDRELIVGPDPRVQGLHWFGGLGGRGMSVAPAAAEWLAAHVLGFTLPPQAAAVSAARLAKFG